MKQIILEALPHTAEQLCTAIVTIVTAIIAAFKKGKKAGKKETTNND
jgi:hypothetical protein